MSTTNAPSKTGETMKAAYNPKEVEAKWTKHWFDNEVFNLDIHPDKPRFSIALPPPNITGSLHMGHALNGTLQDVLIRLKRMQGYNVLWQPGTDHAGISTQIVVERRLKKEGKNRHQLGREAFLEEVWKWRNESGNQILEQYKRLGVSFNWDRIAFTMDPPYVKAIYRAFVTLYNEGFIYRGNRVTNWCPRCLTSLSDLEVEHEETKGHLYCIKYPLVDGTGSLTVATTRPESMLGDVAVAVHPGDDRYKAFVGKKVRLPLTERELPVIADTYVDREFGTGALKITPAHDANDWEVGQRHNLAAPLVIDQEGKMMKCDLVPAKYQGIERFKARELIVEDLKASNELEEERAYVHGVGHCERCNTVIEPYLSEQWYLRMKELAEPAITAVEDERVVFIPERYSSTYLDWMKNIRDWNISRQLWWGHRIPVWTCKKCSHVEAFEETPAACTKCGESQLEQDPDVLDTWFSSALWPFATLGWPEETPVMKAFYPTTVLSTAREIINLWVSRMIFMSLKFMKTIPFKQVLIHPVVQTPDGKRMSKSKQNAVDPLDMIEKYGADANRFYFAAMGIKGDQDVRFREERLEEYKRFANKLFNAGKFTLSQLEGYQIKGIEIDKLTVADAWIMHRYNSMLGKVNAGLNNYDFHEVSRELYDFIWDDFCDWYLEIAKIQLNQETQANAEGQTRRVLHTIFEGIMRALHPIMPFITEELWGQLPKSILFKDIVSIMFTPYPREDNRFLNEGAERQMSFVIRTIKAIRNIRQTFNIPASAEAEVIINGSDKDELAILSNATSYVTRIARANPLKIEEKSDLPKRTAKENFSSITIFVPLDKLIDIEKTKEKLNQRKQSIEREIGKSNEILADPNFKSKAPREKVEAVETKLADLKNQLASVESQLQDVSAS